MMKNNQAVISDANKDICRYALEALKGAGADLAQCQVQKTRVDELNIEGGDFSLLRTVFSTNLSMKAVVGKKKGTITINKSDRASVAEAAAQCVKAANASVEDDAEGISEVIENKVIDNSGAVRDMERFYDRLQEFLADTKKNFPKVILESVNAHYESGEVVFMNTNGVELGEVFGKYVFSDMFSSKDGERSSSFNGYSESMTNLDTPFMEIGMMKTLLAESEQSIDTKPVEGKFVGTMLVSPAALPDFLYAVTGNFLSDGVMIEGTSVMKDSLGKQIASPILTLRAAPYAEGVVCGGSITGDGYINQDMDIIRDGVLKNFLLTRYGAKKTGKERSVNYGEFLTVEPGDSKLEDIVASIDRGILVNRFSGGNPGVSGDISGVAKNSFIIENGRVGAAVSETMISGNLVDMLKNISAISVERINDGGGSLPWVAFANVTISGK